VEKLFEECPIFEQDVGLGDYRRHSGRLAHIRSTQNEDLIVITDGVAVLIEDNQFVAVFLPNLFPELAYARFRSLFGEFILSIHPGLERCGEGHHHKSEVDMRSEGIGMVSSRSLNEPSLLCFPELAHFQFHCGHHNCHRS